MIFFRFGEHFLIINNVTLNINLPICLVLCKIFCKKYSEKVHGSLTPRRGYSQKRPDSIHNYCVQNVRKYDYENFLAVLLLPRLARDSVFAIRAFNVELAQVKDVTTQELIGRMRLQFWKDSLDGIYNDKVPKSPVAKALHHAKVKHNLSKKWLINMIDSRTDGLTDKFYPNLSTVEEYMEKANSSVYYLTLQCMGIHNIKADHMASHLGKGEGIAKLLRGIPYHAARRVVTVPVDLLAQHRVSQEDIIRRKHEPKVKDLIYDIASVAFQHLQQVKDLESEIPKESRNAFLPVVGVAAFLRTLQLVDFNIFDPQLQRRNSLLPAKLGWAKLKNSFR